MYADGASPCSIAAKLNEEGVPSPGAKWKRTERRTDGTWLGSTIHGDVKRGTGILNNRRYAGVMLTSCLRKYERALNSYETVFREAASKQANFIAVAGQFKAV
jgi:hypothetical protein